MIEISDDETTLFYKNECLPIIEEASSNDLLRIINSTKEYFLDNRFTNRLTTEFEELTTLEGLTELDEEDELNAAASTSVTVITSKYCYDRQNKNLLVR